MVSPKFGLLLDVDGPLAHTRTRSIRLDEIARDLAAIANGGCPIVFNTGRSDAFLAERVLPRLAEHGLRPDAPVWGVCEKGATWFALAPESVAIGGVSVDDALRPPKTLVDECHDLAGEHDDLMDWDPTKRAMISIEQRTDVSADEYLSAQPDFVAELQRIVDDHGVADEFRVAPNIIAVDVEHRRTGKALGAARALDLVGERMEPPHRWHTAGDAASDYDMAGWLHDHGFEVEHLDVRPDAETPVVPYPVVHETQHEEDEGMAHRLAQWRDELDG